MEEDFKVILSWLSFPDFIIPGTVLFAFTITIL